MKTAHKTFSKATEGQFGESRKAQARSLQENHQEILQNLMTTIVGKPTIVEAQRVLKVIDQLIANLETFIYLDTEFIGRFSSGKLPKDVLQNLTEETLQLLQHQAEIEQKYRPYANLDQALKEGEEIDEAKKQESERLEKLLQENFKNLLRRVQYSVKDLDIIKQLKSNTNPELNDLVHCVKCMRIIMVKKLSTAEEEQKNHVAQLEELKQKIASYEKTKNQCEQDLLKLRQERQKTTNEKKEEIERLKGSINEVKTNKQKKQEMLTKDMQSKYDVLEKDHKGKEDKLMAELTVLKTNFLKMKADDTTEELQLKRRKAAQDQFLFDTLSNYNSMMEDKTAALQQLSNEVAGIEKELKDKQEYFRLVDGERQREKQLEEMFRIRKEQHIIDQERKQEAARHIQAFLTQTKKTSKKGGKKASKK